LTILARAAAPLPVAAFAIRAAWTETLLAPARSLSLSKARLRFDGSTARLRFDGSTELAEVRLTARGLSLSKARLRFDGSTARRLD